MKSPWIFLHFTFLFLSSLSIAQQSKTDSLLKLLKADKEDTNKVKHLNGLGLEFRIQGNYDKSLSYAGQAKTLSEKIKFKKGSALALNHIGNTYIEQGNYNKALENHLASLKIKEEIGDKQGIASSHNNIGNIYINQGNYTKALENHFAALRIREETGDKQGIAASNLNIGSIYRDQGISAYSSGDKATAVKMLGKALGNFFSSLKVYEEMGNKQYIASCYNNIGNIYKEQGKSAREAGDKSMAASKYDKALESFFTACKIFEEIKLKQGLAIAYNNIGNLYLIKGKTIEAEKHVLASLNIARESGSKEGMMRNYQLLAACDSTIGNWEGAYRHHELYIRYRDSLNNEQTRKKTVETEMTFAFEKKEAAAKAEQDKKDAVAAEEKQKEKTVRYSVIGGLLLVLMVLVIVFRSLKITRKQKVVIEQQKHLVEESRKEIVDSINYAKRIQMALLASKDLLNRNLPPHFVFFNPKDIVSGDFYWATEHDHKFYLAICDSTGHGVPGAFMSLLNIGFLSEAIKEKDILEPHEVLNYVRQRLITSIGNDGQQDGMDAVLICMDKHKQQITYAAANNEPVLIRNNEIIILPKDKMPVGKGERNESFALHTIDLQKNDVLYVYTDGYADQFGGAKGKKFKYKQLNELLVSIHKENPQQQKEKLHQHFLNWKGNLEQVDDVCLVGIAIN